MSKTKCKYMNREMICYVEVNNKEITLKDLKGRVIALLRLSDIVSIEQRGNEFIITMRNSDRISIMITKELLRKIMYVTTLLELGEYSEEVLSVIRKHLITLSRATSLLEEILITLRRGSIPNWDEVAIIATELRKSVLSNLIEEPSKVRASEVTDVLEELSRNIENKYINGIRISAKKIIGIISNECRSKLSSILNSVNLAIAVDVVLYTHAYYLAKKIGARLEADTLKAKTINALSELLNNTFWLNGDEPKRILNSVLSSLGQDNPSKIVNVFVDALINGICRYYSVACSDIATVPDKI